MYGDDRGRALASRSVMDMARRLGVYFPNKASLPKGAIVTHTLLSGGVLALDRRDHYDALFEQCAHDFENEVAMHIAEVIHPEDIFHPYFDFDLKSTTPMTMETKVSIAKVAMNVMRKFFPDAASNPDRRGWFKAVVLGRQPTWQNTVLNSSDTEPRRLLKDGMHIIFPKLNVNQIMNVIIANALIAELTNVLGPRKKGEENDWVEVVDLPVYRNGLRMVYSEKLVSCTECERAEIQKKMAALQREERALAPVREGGHSMELPLAHKGVGTSKTTRASVCKMRGCYNKRCRDGNPYVVQAVVSSFTNEPSRSELRTFLENPRVTLREVTIREIAKTEPTEGFLPDPIDTPAPPLKLIHDFTSQSPALLKTMMRSTEDGSFKAIDMEAKRKLIERWYISEEQQLNTAILRANKKKAKEDVPIQAQSEEALVVQKLIREYHDGRFRDVNVSRITRRVWAKPGKGQFDTVLFVSVRGIGDGACLNLAGRRHSGSKVYFTITPFGIRQRCHSTKAAGASRVSGVPCCDWRGAPYKELTKAECVALFGEKGYSFVEARRVTDPIFDELISITKEAEDEFDRILNNPSRPSRFLGEKSKHEDDVPESSSPPTSSTSSGVGSTEPPVESETGVTTTVRKRRRMVRIRVQRKRPTSRPTT